MVERRRIHPAIRGMLQLMPAPGDPWDEDERNQWIESFDALLKMIYRNNGDGKPPTGPVRSP